MRRRIPDIVIIALLFLLPLLVFWQQTLGGRTLLPTENIYQYEPWSSYREVVHAPDLPHNALVSDLILENYQWKHFIRQSLAQGEIPLWNPYQFSGIPFMAAGQQSMLYPLSLIYYILPLTAAYGWFTVVQLWLAGAFMYAFLRGLHAGRFGAVIAGVCYQLAAFFVISAVFPMIIAAAAWMPLLLLMIEFTVRQRPLFGRPVSAPWVAIGAVALGCNVLAGHVEITYYTLLIAGYYAAARMLVLWWQQAKSVGARHAVPLQRAAWLLGMIVLGMALGAVQWIPLFELASLNFRSGSASYETVVGWAHPLRDLLQFALPNFYGSPAHHSYFDWFSGQTVPLTVNALGEAISNTEWGMRNYVEGALYVGILPLALAAYGLLDTWFDRRDTARRVPTNRAATQIIFLILAVLSLTLMFGLPTYRLLYLLPGIDQLHSPFRWIYAVTLSVAVLAGLGADRLQSVVVGTRHAVSTHKAIAYGLIALGLLALAGLLFSRLFYAQVEPLMQWILDNMATPDGNTARTRFASAAMFYSYQFGNVLIFGIVTFGSGLIFWWAGRDAWQGRTRHAVSLHDNDVSVGAQPAVPAQTWGGLPRWQIATVALVAADLMIASWGFNPASDPALLDFTPPAIQWLQNQPGDWRYITLDDPSQSPILNANLGWSYGLRDVRGYESIIPKQYVDYMQEVVPQRQLEFNRVAPLYVDQLDTVDWGRLSLLNVRYIITARSINLYDYLPPLIDPQYGVLLQPPPPVYEDESLRIWDRLAMPRAYLAQILDGSELHIEDGINQGWDVVIDRDTGREKVLHANVSSVPETSWLVISETYMPGWRAFVRPRGGSDDLERPLPLERVLGNFQGINVSQSVIEEAYGNRAEMDAMMQAGLLPEAQYEALRVGQITIRVVYSPTSFQIGLFFSFIGVVLVIFMLGVWLWRLFVVAEDTNPIARVARNSFAPIILNIFNRGIDFAFAFVMLRILGPEHAGVYFYAGIIFVWFDIFTNFGLDVYLTREVARQPERAARYFFTTSAIRMGLTLVGLLLLALFLLGRQSLVSPALSSEGIVAIILLYIGLFPGSLSKGMTSLFYAFQQAEYPAAMTTLSTISKTVLGLGALLLGYGVIGLAAVSIVTNLLTLALLLWGGRKLIGAWHRPDTGLMRSMSFESWPLMVNHFLATIFFQIDVLIIEAIHGVVMVGLYSVAYKWLSALNIIPAFFTQAMLPVMSRQAHEDPEALKRTYVLAIKLLVSLALPLAVLFTFLAYFLTYLLGGTEFLPDGAIATQIMIWSIPIGWINSLTQYVLIALDLQRRIMGAFTVAVSFNIITNLLLVPQYGYQAAAVTTIASELILLIPFALLLRGALGKLPWGQMLWRPVTAAAAMLTVMALLWETQTILALVASLMSYAIILLLLRPLEAQELERLRPLLPAPLRRRISG